MLGPLKLNRLLGAATPRTADHGRHVYRPGITDQQRWAKHLIATKNGHAR